jgi:dTDP-4-dehydrorhamnose 3,5-epimerase-like enzyme
MTGVDDCRLLDLPKISAPEGSITPVEGGAGVAPFEIARVFYVYDVVGGAVRAGHAHKKLEEFIVAVMGSFTVVLADGERERRVELTRAYQGLYVPALIWTELVHFSSGAVAVVLCSDHYDEADYIRDRDEFVAYRRSHAAGA